MTEDRARHYGTAFVAEWNGKLTLYMHSETSDLPGM